MAPKYLCVAVLALLLAAETAHAGRVLQQETHSADDGHDHSADAVTPALLTDAANATGSSGSSASYPSFMEAVTAANSTTNLTTLVAAVEAAGVASGINDTTAWTILAPTNEAFSKRLPLLNLTAEQLLDPSNKALLVAILSYHVIPTGAYMSANLTNDTSLPTALANAGNLTVVLEGSNVTFLGASNNASVVAADIMAGASVIHVINDVLVPPLNAEVSNTTSSSSPAQGGAAGGAMMPGAAAAGGAGDSGAESTNTSASSPAP